MVGVWIPPVIAQVMMTFFCLVRHVHVVHFLEAAS